MRICTVPNIGVYFYLDEDDDSFLTALCWVREIRENCEKTKKYKIFKNSSGEHGAWSWMFYGTMTNHPLEATDSGVMYTTNFDEAAMFRLAAGLWTNQK